MPRTVIVNGRIVSVPDDAPRPAFRAFAGQGHRLGGLGQVSNLVGGPVRPRHARAESHPRLLRPELMSLDRYEMLLTLREYMNLSAMGDVLVFGASKEIDYPFLCTPCSHITMVSDDDNSAENVLARLRTCAKEVQLLGSVASASGLTLRVATSASSIPLTIKQWKMTYSRFRAVCPSKRYDCLIDKASWLYTDPQGWADYLDKLKVDGYLITDVDYSWGGSAPWLTEVFGLHEVTSSVVGTFRQRHTGYGYDEDSARIYVKVKQVPSSLMQKALVNIAKMAPLLQLYRFPTMSTTGLWLEWHKHRALANLLREVAQHARQLSRLSYGPMALRLDQVAQRFLSWIAQKEREDREAHTHYRDDE